MALNSLLCADVPLRNCSLWQISCVDSAVFCACSVVHCSSYCAVSFHVVSGWQVVNFFTV